MNNTIEFVLRMRDLMSSNITKVSAASQTVFTKMSQSANQMTGRNNVLGMSFDELQKKIRQVESTISKSTVPSQIAEARRELQQLQQMASKHQGNINPKDSSKGIGIGGIAVGSMVGNLASQGIGMLVGGVKAGIGEMVSQSMQKEQAITGLTTFLGKQGAQDAYKNIRQDANVTPYDTASLLEVNRALISAGANAKDARTDTMNLANAVSAVGGGNDVLTRMAANMQQIKTVGKATSMDIRQFGIAGINIYEMLARSTGKNIKEVKEMDVTYADLSKALAMSNSKGGIYEGAMAAQSQTMSGKWSTVKDNFSTAASDIGDAFSPVFNKLLDLGIKFANAISPALQSAQPYIDAMSNGIGKAVDYIMAIVNGTSTWSGWVNVIRDVFLSIWDISVKIGTNLWNLVSRVIDFVKQSQILKDLFLFIGWIFEKVGAILVWIGDKILWIWDNVLRPILNAVEWIYKHLTGRGLEVKSTTKIIPAPKKPDDSPIGKGMALTKDNATSSEKAGDTVSGAGPKVINIHVGKFFDNLQFTTLNMQETAQELENITMECLSRVLYNGAKTI
jgi:tape measure domain-containing protein